METQLQTISLSVSLLLTGLSAGLFFAWSVSVIPGTLKVDTPTYLATMQSINREILNPAFFIIFFGSLLSMIGAMVLAWDLSSRTFWYLAAAILCYGIGTVIVTGLGNVPLNDKLDALQLELLNEEKLDEFRAYYELRWNRLHTIRMLFSVSSFILLLFSQNSYSNNS